jgi:hypothetical protein
MLFGGGKSTRILFVAAGILAQAVFSGDHIKSDRHVSGGQRAASQGVRRWRGDHSGTPWRENGQWRARQLT